MNGLLTQSFLTALVAGGIVAAVPLMFTALGESVSERAGVLNIGLEGMMLLGAYLGFLGAYELHSQWLGFLAGMAGGLSGAIVMALLSVGMGLDQIVVGIAITLAGEGITSVLQQAQFKGKFPGLGNPATVAIPGLSRLPVLGHSLFDQPLLVYLGFGLLALVAWVFRATSWGLNLRAAGEKPEALDAAGISVQAVRTYAVLTTGALAGLGGAYLAIVGANTFTPFMTQGQGFIAIVIAMLARGKPHLGAFQCAIRTLPSPPGRPLPPPGRWPRSVALSPIITTRSSWMPSGARKPRSAGCSGLRLWPKSEDIAAACVTAIAVPEGLDHEAVRNHVREHYGVMLSSGQGAGNLVRIGHMGPTADGLKPIVGLMALGRSLADLGAAVRIGAGVEAALDRLARLQQA